jgi:pimeloyl-ACP methyl ester carboxylesterase
MPDFRKMLEQLPLHEAVTSRGRITYRCHGLMQAAEPVVLLHGIGSGAASWAHQLQTIGMMHPVYAWDAPGYGGSTPLEAEEPAAEDYAEALIGWLDKLGIVRCMLIGHSLGAIMASAFAGRQPKRVAGLMLISPAGGYAKADPEVRIEKRDSRLRMLEELGPQGLADQRSANLLSPDADEHAREWVRWNMARILPTGYRQATHLLANADLVDELRSYAGPLSVAVGSRDAVTTPSACEQLAARLQQQYQGSVDYHVFDGLGHACYIEAPDTVTSHIASFIKQK